LQDNKLYIQRTKPNRPAPFLLKKVIRVGLVLLFSFILCGCFRAYVKGIVRNQNNSAGIGGALVQAKLDGGVVASTTTSSDGSYNLLLNLIEQDTTSLTFLLTFDKNYYSPFETQRVIKHNHTLRLNPELTPLDTSPPTTPVVLDDGDTTQSNTSLHFSFSSQDAESGIVGYRYSIGTQPYNNDVVFVGFSGLDTEVTHTGLDLAVGHTYYINVKAKNGVELWSDAGTSDGITVETTIPLPAFASYGNIHDADRGHINEVVFSFPATAGDTTLYYDVYDIDNSTEVEIILNGNSLGYAPISGDSPNQWLTNQSIHLPQEFLNSASSNILIFDNTNNPPSVESWGVRNVFIDLISINNGAIITPSVEVMINVLEAAASGGFTHMQFSHDAVNWTPAQPFAITDISWTLTSGDGTKIVFARFQKAGEWLAPVYDTIILDTAGPKIIHTLPSDLSKFYEAETLNFDLEIEDLNFDGLESQYWYEDSLILPWSAYPDYNFIWQLPDDSFGLKDFKFEIRDGLGRQDTKEIEVFVFKKPPEP